MLLLFLCLLWHHLVQSNLIAIIRTENNVRRSYGYGNCGINGFSRQGNKKPTTVFVLLLYWLGLWFIFAFSKYPCKWKVQNTFKMVKIMSMDLNICVKIVNPIQKPNEFMNSFKLWLIDAPTLLLCIWFTFKTFYPLVYFCFYYYYLPKSSFHAYTIVLHSFYSCGFFSI